MRYPDIQIIGIDCAAQRKKCGLAIADGSTVSHLTVGETDPIGWILGRIASDCPTLVCIDSPLGWPSSLGTELASHRAGGPIHTPPNALFRRATDLMVHERVGKLPLEVGADRIARTAVAALSLLADLRKRTGLPFPVLLSEESQAHGVIEVYPAATLKARGLRSSGYKGSGTEESSRRLELLRALQSEISLMDTRLAESSDDAFDACVCILAGLDFLNRRCISPVAVSRIIQTEGWIWVAEPDRVSPTSG